MRETLAERNARYLAEGRTVSGGDGNGPGKPGYAVKSLTGNDEADSALLNSYQDQGYELLFVFNSYISSTGSGGTRVILGNYKKD